ncbi:MAG: flavodoxin-dependent (E)-4-hydroxy-3-methylbut-2-enyl-diphosphate synthase [Clostridia bacterium]|nr:flavodoxin-dependent (E)-4-hydroxy-3-methylbut-2-enyl-diphosphate synthase [Clostridia bacterium]
MQGRLSKQVTVGGVAIGGGAPVTVQSMLNRPADDMEGSVKQAIALEQAGCEIIRAAVPTLENVPLIAALKQAVSCPIVADIHFDYRIALACVGAGVDKIRINPGNIGDETKVKAVADACKSAGIPIRIGVNSGSTEKHLLAKYGGPTPAALAESALYHASLLEKFDFTDIVISAKSSDVQNTFETYRILSEKCDYPLHLGVTEAGTKQMGIMKSAAGIGGLLLSGIGDTIRISLTDDPVEEVIAARRLLKAIGLRREGATLVSCPTCGRTKIDLIGLAAQVEELLETVDRPIKVAVMGCVVNGPGEAKEADIGIAGGDGCGVIFKKGEILRKLPEDQLLNGLKEELHNLMKD